MYEPNKIPKAFYGLTAQELREEFRKLNNQYMSELAHSASVERTLNKTAEERNQLLERCQFLYDANAHAVYGR